MRVDVFSIFPEVVDSFCSASLLGKARTAGLLDLRCHDIRDHATDVHRSVDDAPYGGGAGMVMTPDPIFAAVEAVGAAAPAVAARAGRSPVRPVDRTRARGRRRVQPALRALRGVDHRVREHLVDGELSVGDVVLSGGEVAACVVVDAVTRLLPGAMGNAESPVTESFGAGGLLEEPQYTRPATFRGWSVPEVLLSGNHGLIARWRAAQVLHRTLRTRPDLVEQRGGLRPDEVALLEEFPAVPYP